MFSVVVNHLTRSDADINRVSKELPTGEALSTRMLVSIVHCQLEMFNFLVNMDWLYVVFMTADT